MCEKEEDKEKYLPSEDTEYTDVTKKTPSKSRGGQAQGRGRGDQFIESPQCGLDYKASFRFHDVTVEFHLAQSNNISLQNKAPRPERHRRLVQSNHQNTASMLFWDRRVR